MTPQMRAAVEARYKATKPADLRAQALRYTGMSLNRPQGNVQEAYVPHAGPSGEYVIFERLDDAWRIAHMRPTP
jgi:hypothetical protein